VKQSPQWKSILSSAKSTLKTGPLWRLQKLQGKDECFLYAHITGQKHIELNPGVVDCFQRFYDLVVSLARNHWLDKIRSIKANHKLIGDGDLDSFLFGTHRATLAKVQPVLFDIQKGQCFYCQKNLQKEKSQVDHFIPWARYPHDLGHNFVLAHSTCNNNKRDHLAAHEHSDRWHEQNIILNGTTLTNELDGYFTCDAQRSEAVATWAYRLAHQNGVSLWLSKDQFVPAV
jgi:5-methylcytosine-specific restriction endonuclease McrA